MYFLGHKLIPDRMNVEFPAFTGSENNYVARTLIFTLPSLFLTAYA